MPQTLLLPLDGSDSSDRAAEYALDRAERDGSTIHALYVVDTTRYGEPALSSGEVLIDEAEDEGHRLLGSFAASANARGVPVEARCCHGRPPEEILAHARAIDADVVVLHSRVPHATRTELADVAETVVTRGEAKVA